MAPNRKPSSGENPSRKIEAMLTIRAVSATPAVERQRPFVRTGRTSDNRVSIPPEKRISARPTTPMDCAKTGSLNAIPPGPSEPASIPTKMKIRRAGRPSRPDTLLAMMLTRMRIAAPARMYSMAIMAVSPQWVAGLGSITAPFQELFSGDR
jgi:hypothetical protein